MIGPKVHVTSSSTDVNNGTPCTASGNDQKTSGQFSDAVQLTKEQKDVQNSSIKENGVAKESGDGEVTGAPMVGDKNGNKAIPERPQESPGKDDAHGRAENDGEEAVAPEDRIKRGKGVDDGAKGANADKRLNSNAADISDSDKTDPGQGTGAVESQNNKTESDATKSPEKQLLKDDNGNSSQPERGGPEKETEVDDGAKGTDADKLLNSNAADINVGYSKNSGQGTGAVESQNNQTENDASKSLIKQLLKDDDGNSSQPQRGWPEKETDKKSAEINEKNVTATKNGASKFDASTKGSLAVQPTNAHGTANPPPCPKSKYRPDLDKEFLNVIFHSLLTPTFSLNVHQGERVVLRGHSPFSWSAEKQVNMRVVRY